MHPDGGVDVVAWTRCATGLNAFEFGVSVTQSGRFGTVIRQGPAVVPCDGVAHRSDLTVHADAGTFVRGPARLDAFLSANDPQDGDIDVTDTAQVFVRRAWSPAVVRLRHRPAPLGSDGAVRIVLWSRCQPWFQAFELDLGVSQAGAGGSSTALGPEPVVRCDGAWHRTVKRVFPDAGSFTPGPADVSVFIGFYDPRTDHDLEATDTATVRLYRPAVTR